MTEKMHSPDNSTNAASPEGSDQPSPPVDEATNVANAVTADDGSAESYFDRERWYDVESREAAPAAVPFFSFGEPKTGLSAFSVAVLGIVALVAGVLGVLAIHFLPTIPFEHPPISPKGDFRTVPQQWVGYRLTSVFPVNAPNGQAFFVDEEHRVFLGADKQIVVYSDQGLYLQTFTLPDVPQAMVLSDADTLLPGKVFIAYRDRVEVYSLSRQGDEYALNLHTQWPPFEGAPNLRSITLSQDAVYIGDPGEKVVYQCDERGKLRRRIGFPAEKAPQDKSDAHPEERFEGFVVLAVPTLSVSFARDTGILYVANPGKHRVEAFTPDGHWESALSWGDVSAAFTGFCGCCNPVGLQVLDNGLLMTVEKSVNRIKLYDNRGKLSTVVAPSELLDRLPRNLLEVRGRDTPRNLLPNASTTPVLATSRGELIYVFDPVFQIVHTLSPDAATHPAADPPGPETSTPDSEVAE